MNVRKLAEEKIDEITTHDFGGFMLECARELAQETRSTSTRQLASTLIKNLLHHSPKNSGKWGLLDQNLRNEIKNTVLSCLASEIKDVRKAAASSVAGKIF
jgi:hypothetical protein